MNTAVDDGGNFAGTENFAAPPRGPVDAIRACLAKFLDLRDGALLVLVRLCLLKGKPQQNLFDRGGESREFSLNRRPA